MNQDYKTRVAVYLRKSRSDDPNETIDETLERHNRILTEYALKNGVSVLRVYKEVVSGDGLFTRPQMIQLLNDIEQGLYTAVMCVDIDRLGRSSTKDSGIILETLKDAHCCIITPEKVYNLEDDVDEMTVELKTFFARQELKSIRKRLYRGEIETLKAGGHTGEPPYGYRRIWLDKIPSLEPVPDEAEAVKMIYNWYVNDGFGSSSIADRLNALGIKAPDGGLFARTSVRHILANPIYKGAIVWNRTRVIKKKKPTDKWRELRNPRENWIEAKGLHEAIISEEQWETAQNIRKERSHPPSFTGYVKNPYSGLVVCAKCGTVMQRQIERKSREERLLCPTTGCMPSIKIKLLDERIRMGLVEMLSELKLNENNRKKQSDNNLELQLRQAEKQIKTLSSQRSRLHDLLEQGVYDISTFMERQSSLTRRLTQAENQVKKLQEEQDKASINISEIIPTIEGLLKDWDTLTPPDKNRILKQIIKRIVYRRSSRNFTVTDFETSIEWRF